MTKTVKTALAAVTLAAATFALPTAAFAGDYRKDCSDTENAILGGVVGGSLGTVIGEEIAGRGDRTEGAVLGAIIGGIAGAAIGDGASDCEKRTTRTRSYNKRGYPVRTTTRGHSGYQTVGHNGHRGHNGHNRNRNRNHNTGYGYDTRRHDPLYQIDRQIEEVRREGDRIKREIKYSRYYNPRLEQARERNGRRLKNLKRERKRIKQFNERQRDRGYDRDRNRGYGYNDGYRRGHYHGGSRTLCYSDH